jgi:hypothetical protein
MYLELGSPTGIATNGQHHIRWYEHMILDRGDALCCCLLSRWCDSL